MSVTFRTECEAVGEKMLQLYASTIEEIKDNARQIEYIASSSDLVELKKKNMKLKTYSYFLFYIYFYHINNRLYLHFF